jgi:hypothetical protein
MPLKLTAGVSKKLGLPGYSSVGASCHVELELDSGLIFDAPHVFRAHLQEVYERCAEAVEEELARQRAPRNPAGPALEGAATATAGGSANGNGQAHAGSNGNDNGNGHARSPAPLPSRTHHRPASRISARQSEYAQTLAGQLGIDAQQLDGLCQRLFKKTLAELSGGEASTLIGTLQEMREDGPQQDPAYRPDDE